MKYPVAVGCAVHAPPSPPGSVPRRGRKSTGAAENPLVRGKTLVWGSDVRFRRRERTLEVTCLATSVAAASRSSGLSAAVSLERSIEDIVDSACLRCNRVVQSVSAARAGVQCRQSAGAVPTRIMSSSPLRCFAMSDPWQINREFVKNAVSVPQTDDERNLTVSAMSADYHPIQG